MGYITQEGLQNLKKYQYVSGGYSTMDKVMNHWWEFVVTLVPRSIAPNLITLIGLIINMLGSLQFLLYDTTFTMKMPPCMIYIATLCGFLYQTLDAIDGKQARRTQSSSPLGQLFDHGCDAISVFFGLNSFLFVLRLGCSYQFFILLFSTTLTFFTQQWEEYHAHVMRTNIGGFGVTEGILLQLLTMLLIGLTDGGLAEWAFGDFLPMEGLPPFVRTLKITDVGIFMILLSAIKYAYMNISCALQKT